MTIPPQRLHRAATLLAIATLVACAAGAPTATAPAAPPALDNWVHQIVEAFNAHDAERVRAGFSPDAQLTLIGDGGPVAIGPLLAALLSRVRDAHLAIGRTWLDQRAVVIELVFSGTCTAGPLLGTTVRERPISLAAAAVFTFGPTGRSAPSESGAPAPPTAQRRVGPDHRPTGVRLYADVATALGQVEPALLPPVSDVRPLEPAPRAATFVAQGNPGEARRLALANAIWDALDAHDAARVLAGSSDDYRYVDFAAPRVLNKAETQALVAGFLTAVANFRIAEKSLQLAAGDYVITEMSETATLAGRPIALHALDIKRFAGDLVVEEWQYSNYIEILTQARGMAPPNLTAR